MALTHEKRFAAPNDPRLLEYLERTFRPEDPALIEIRERAGRAGLPDIHVGDLDGLHIEILARACGARKAVEIGTLAGYSGLHILRGMAPEGKLFTFEYEPRHAEVARETFRKNGFAERAQLFVGPALENLSKIEKEGPFDLVFIDADKESYPKYLAWADRNLRVGGMVLGDNTLAFGMIADESFEDPEDEETVRAIREFNSGCGPGTNFKGTLLPTGEGLTVAVKIR